MLIMVLKGARNFGTKNKSLALTTWDEVKKLTEQSVVMEDKIERGTEPTLPLVWCDQIESVVTREELTFSWSDEQGDLLEEVGP